MPTDLLRSYLVIFGKMSNRTESLFLYFCSLNSCIEKILFVNPNGTPVDIGTTKKPGIVTDNVTEVDVLVLKTEVTSELKILGNSFYFLYVFFDTVFIIEVGYLFVNFVNKLNKILSMKLAFIL